MNLDSPIPANGALVFLVDCWHDCTACSAAGQRLDITVSDSTKQAVHGQKPEQVFLSEDALRHLVLWRPSDSPRGGGYEVSVGVQGQDDTQSYPFQFAALHSPVDAPRVFSASVTTFRVERGTSYWCDQSQNDCDTSSLSFGSQYELLPALDVGVARASDGTLRGQLLYHVMHHASDGSKHWGSWQVASDAPDEMERFNAAQSQYCADVELRSLLDAGNAVRQTLCQPHGDLQAPVSGQTDVTTELQTCIRPPSGLEPEWCAVQQPECATNAYSSTCTQVAQTCVDPIARGTAGPVAPVTDETAVEAADLCASARDPYDEEVRGCTCRVGAPSERRSYTGLAIALMAWIALRRRARHQEGPALAS